MCWPPPHGKSMSFLWKTVRIILFDGCLHFIGSPRDHICFQWKWKPFADCRSGLSSLATSVSPSKTQIRSMARRNTWGLANFLPKPPSLFRDHAHLLFMFLREAYPSSPWPSWGNCVMGWYHRAIVSVSWKVIKAVTATPTFSPGTLSR